MIAEHTGQTESRSPRHTEGLDYTVAALVCLALVSGVWFSFSRGEETLTSADIPIEYLKRDPGMEIVETSASAIRLDLSGSGPLIRSLRPEQIKVQIGLEAMREGTQTIVLPREIVRQPPGISLKKMTPSVVEITLEKKKKKSVPVQVDWTGPLAKGLRLVSVEVLPARTRVVGSRRQLAKVSTLYTEKISMADIQTSGSLVAGLALQEGIKAIAAGAPERVTVHYVVTTPAP